MSMNTTITAMYLFAGYRDAIMNHPGEQDINAAFSGGGEDSSAVKLAEVAALYHATEQSNWRDGPGVWLYDVVEEAGRAIADRTLEYIEAGASSPDVRECVEMLENATQHWADS